MNTTAETYRPFFNRRVAPDIRQLIADRHQWMREATQVAMHHFAKPALPTSVTVTPFRRRFFGDTHGHFPRLA